LVQNIQRISLKGTGVRGRSNPDEEPNFWNMPWVIPHSHTASTENSSALIQTATIKSIERIPPLQQNTSYPEPTIPSSDDPIVGPCNSKSHSILANTCSLPNDVLNLSLLLGRVVEQQHGYSGRRAPFDARNLSDSPSYGLNSFLPPMLTPTQHRADQQLRMKSQSFALKDLQSNHEADGYDEDDFDRAIRSIECFQDSIGATTHAK
jgi:hypothetical protein